MNRKIRQLVSVDSPPGQLNWKDRAWKWIVGGVAAVVEFVSEVRDWINESIGDVAELIIPEASNLVKGGATLLVKVGAVIVLMWVTSVVRKKRGPSKPSGDESASEGK